MRKKRIRKSLRRYCCPMCKCRDGMLVFQFLKGNRYRELFVWCAGCNHVESK